MCMIENNLWLLSRLSPRAQKLTLKWCMWQKCGLAGPQKAFHMRSAVLRELKVGHSFIPWFGTVLDFHHYGTMASSWIRFSLKLGALSLLWSQTVKRNVSEAKSTSSFAVLSLECLCLLFIFGLLPSAFQCKRVAGAQWVVSLCIQLQSQLHARTGNSLKGRTMTGENSRCVPFS